MTSGLRRSMYRRRVAGPGLVVGAAISAGFAQLGDQPNDWPQGGDGYGRRLASAAGRTVVHASLEAGSAAALGYDMRYRPSTETGFIPRLGHAVLGSVTARNARGGGVLAIPRLVGAAGGAAAQSAWQPAGGVDARFVGRNVLGSVAIGAALNVFREFRPPRAER